jgi:hypothetical protein
MITAGPNAHETRSLHFFVSSMLAALAAKLGELETACSRLLVLGGGVILILAISTLQLNDFAGHLVELLSKCAQLSLSLVRVEARISKISLRGNQGLKPPWLLPEWRG